MRDLDTVFHTRVFLLYFIATGWRVLLTVSSLRLSHCLDYESLEDKNLSSASSLSFSS